MGSKTIKRTNRIFVIVFIFYIISSGIFLYSRYLHYISVREQKALTVAKAALIGLDDNQIFKLQGHISDQETYAYRDLKRRLTEMTSIDEEIVFSYLYIQRDGELYFLVDSEEIDSEDYSPPGQHYSEASPESFIPFETGQYHITEPITDRWGTWVSVLIPLIDNNGNVHAVFGQDYPARTWNTRPLTDTLNTAGLLFALMFILFTLYITIKSRARVIDNERKFKKLAENTSDIIWTSDLNFNITYVSPSVEKIVGESPKKHMKRKFEEKFPPQYIKGLKEIFKKEIEKKEKSEGLTIEVEHYKADGTTFWAEMSLKFILDNKKNPIGIQGITRDITDRRKAQDEVNKIMKSVEQSPSSIVITDTEGTIEYVNPKFTEVTGYTLEEAIGENPRILKSDHFTKAHYKKLWDTIKSGRTWNGEFHNKKKNGESYWESAAISPVKDQNGKIINFIAVKEDITEKKEIEEKLEESRKEYESLVGNLPGVAYRCHNDKNWTMIFISDHIKEITEYPPEDFIDNKKRSLASIIHKDDIKAVEEEILKSIKIKKPWNIEYRIITKNGKVRWIKEKGSKLKGTEKGNDILDGIIIDITEQKKIQDEIKMNEKRYEELIKQSRTFIWEVDKDANYTYVSNNSKEIIGYTKKEMEGKMNVFDLHPKEGLEDFKKGVKKTLKNKEKINKLENPIIHKNGETVWVLSFGLPILDDNGNLKCYRGSDFDITQKKKDTERIKQNLEQQKLLSEVSTQLSAYTSLDRTLNSILRKIGEHTNSDRAYIFRDSKDGQTTSNTHKWCNTGIKSEIDNLQDIPYKDIKGVIDAFEKSGILKAADISELEPGIRKNLEIQDIKSVLIIPLLIRKKRIGFIAFDQVKEKREWSDADINLLSTIANSISTVYEREENMKEVKKYAEEIANDKNRIEAIIKGIGDGVFVINEDREIIIFNKTASEISGYPIEEALGKPYKEILNFRYEENNKINDEFVERVFSTGESQEMVNHTYLISKDGAHIPVADSAAPIKDSSGKITDCVVVFRDVSKEREVDKMKTEFVSVASHQLKTPLSGIKWMSDLLMEEKAGKLSKEQKEYINDIQFSNDRMIRLIDDLLNVSHIETGEKFNISKKKTNVVKLVEEVLMENMELAQKKKVRITKCENAPSRLMMNIDGEKIKEVFANLINNAIKYSKEGGEVEIGCDSKKNEKVFWIKDSGIGIPKKQQKEIFNKFFRADNAFTQETDGTGLGLYIAKSVIEAHGGKIWFESESNKGTTFFFSIPTATKKK